MHSDEDPNPLCCFFNFQWTQEISMAMKTMLRRRTQSHLPLVAVIVLFTSVQYVGAFRALTSSRSGLHDILHIKPSRSFGRQSTIENDRKQVNGQGLQMLPIVEAVAASTTAVTSHLPSFLTASTFIDALNNKQAAEAVAGPFFGASLFPYIAFLYFLDVKENNTPKGVTVGFATCLLFVFLTIPAAIASELLFGVSLADCDWLHGSAESLLTITNLVTVIAFRQALRWKEQQKQTANEQPIEPPVSVISYAPMILLVLALTALATVTVLVPALDAETFVHTPYLGGFMDLPSNWVANWGRHAEPENALTVACWIIHWSSLVEFLVAMGFAWRWADVVGNKRWRGVTWGLLPLHSSGIVACTYHLFYNSIPLLVPLQAFLTFVGNLTAAYAAYRLAVSNGWNPSSTFLFGFLAVQEENENFKSDRISMIPEEESPSLIGFEDLGQALSNDTDYTFLVKLFAGCAVASYAVKYGELQFDFPFSDSLGLGIFFVLIPSALNAFKWYKRSTDPTFEGWF